ncbi:hypothetical protein [Marinitenerispora sediminis]|uniref:SH3 domain-containing protein n=1 Tax=Marinitenerispora sediminis TaxID=1931232 RepID=A0A368T5U8_9ACTN|nr:hypothetical protein [Marinitenerispora sediminis]RCV58976.1 hypothetical protein DEF24_11455 [Marinitenerispora sediminis]RCV61267.1 hypothetical protein DEF23_02590 [Marinitenerispora sediminis]
MPMSSRVAAVAAAATLAFATVGLSAPTARAATTAGTGGALSSAATICPYETTRSTPRCTMKEDSTAVGSWSSGARVNIYQGSLRNGGLRTTATYQDGLSYWVTASHVRSTGASCRS